VSELTRETKEALDELLGLIDEDDGEIPERTWDRRRDFLEDVQTQAKDMLDRVLKYGATPASSGPPRTGCGGREARRRLTTDLSGGRGRR
jgi:hypothetical protein